MKAGKDSLVYIQKNWLKQTDQEMGEALGLQVNTIYNYRHFLKLSRIKKKPLDKKLVAFVLERYVNRTPLKIIAERLGISGFQVGKILSAHYFTKKRSYDTVTLVLDSKINYD